MGLNAPHVTPQALRAAATRSSAFPLLDSAADTIEALTAEIERLRAIVAACGIRAERIPAGAEARHFLRHLATNGHHITTTKDTPR